jgi:hypothetical protein
MVAVPPAQSETGVRVVEIAGYVFTIIDIVEVAVQIPLEPVTV